MILQVFNIFCWSRRLSGEQLGLSFVAVYSSHRRDTVTEKNETSHLYTSLLATLKDHPSNSFPIENNPTTWLFECIPISLFDGKVKNNFSKKVPRKTQMFPPTLEVWPGLLFITLDIQIPCDDRCFRWIFGGLKTFSGLLYFIFVGGVIIFDSLIVFGLATRFWKSIFV